MDKGASSPADGRWEAGRRYQQQVEERAKLYAKLPPNPPENIRREDAHLASHLSNLKLPKKPPSPSPSFHANKRQKTGDNYQSPRASKGPPVDTPRGPKNATYVPVFRNYDSSIIGGFQEVVGATGKQSSASNRQVLTRIEPAPPAPAAKAPTARTNLQVRSLEVAKVLKSGTPSTVISRQAASREESAPPAPVAKAPATNLQVSTRGVAEVRESGTPSTVIAIQAASRKNPAIPERTAKSPAIKQEDKDNISAAVTPKPGNPQLAPPSGEKRKINYWQRSGQASVAGGNEESRKREEEAKHKQLNIIDPIIDGNHKYLIKLDYRPSFRASYLGVGPGEESVNKVAEELGVKLCNRYKTQQLHIWAEPIRGKGEATSDPAKARCEHALAFLEFWRWRVLEDERKNRPSCSLVDACTWFHDLDSAEVRDWLRESGRRSDPREAPLTIR